MKNFEFVVFKLILNLSRKGIKADQIFKITMTFQTSSRLKFKNNLKTTNSKSFISKMS